MRRLFASLSPLVLLASLAGCHSTHGICDCDIPGHKCCHEGCAWHHFAPGVSPPAKAEAIGEPKNEPPKADVKPLPAKEGDE